MSFSFNLPPEMCYKIVNYFNPSKMSSEEVRLCGREVAVLSLIDTKINSVCEEKLENLKKIYELINKYSEYNDQYSLALERGIDIGGNPQLLDAVLTGTNFKYVGRTSKVFNAETEEDIRTIVKLTPESMCCTIGQFGTFDSVYPIFAACLNENITASVLEFLIKSGANQKFQPDELIYIKENVNPERFEMIANLL